MLFLAAIKFYDPPNYVLSFFKGVRIGNRFITEDSWSTKGSYLEISSFGSDKDKESCVDPKMKTL